MENDMDLSTIVPTGRQFELLHPQTDEPTGIIFHLRSPDAPEVKKVQRDWQDRMLAPKRRSKNVGAEDLEAFQKERIIAQVEGWEFTNSDFNLGPDQEFTPKLLRSLLKKLPWLQTALTAETEDLSAFLTGPADSSSA
jgi:hypothetical protein